MFLAKLTKTTVKELLKILKALCCFKKNFPWINVPQTIHATKLPPGQLSPEQLPLNNSPLDNYLWVTVPYENPPRTIAPGLLPLKQLPPNNSLLENYPSKN